MPETAAVKKRARGPRPGTKAKAAARPRRAAPRVKSGVITIVQIRSGIGCNFTHKRVLRALGLRHPHHRVVRTDNPAVRGMVEAIPHLARIVEESRG